MHMVSPHSFPAGIGVCPESFLSFDKSKSAEKMDLSSLRSKMKCDPEGYESELVLIYHQFKSSLNILKQQVALSFTSVTGVSADHSIAKELRQTAMFLAHVTPFYAKHLCDEFLNLLVELLQSLARSLPSSLRCHLTKALILLINRKIVDIGDTLALFMELQALGDKNLKKLAFSHVVHSIRRMNLKHKNDVKNRSLQNVLFAMLQQEDEKKAKRSLLTLHELHRRKVWFDDRTANAICIACFHSSKRILIATLSILMDYEKIEDGYDSDDSSCENDATPQNPQLPINKQAIYKANQKGTLASKKKKKAKLQRAIRSMKRQQRLSSEKSISSHYSPLYHLNDAQGFAEMLLARLETLKNTYEDHEVKVMILKVIARTIGLHRLVLLNFFPYLQKYVQPHQRDVTILLAAALEACHDMVPDYVIKPFLKQIVDLYVNDRSRPEAIAVGLNVVREICLRVPWLMTTEGGQELLQDLVLYKKSSMKAVSTAARSLITLFREICPSLLVKKDRGRCTDPKMRPKAFGEVNVFSNVPGVELLDDDWDGDEIDKDSTCISSDDEHDHEDEVTTSGEDEQHQLSDDDDLVGVSDDSDDNEDENYSTSDGDEDEDEEQGHWMDDHENANDLSKSVDPDAKCNRSRDDEFKTRKRKLIDIDGQIKAADLSLRAIKRLAAGTRDGILSNEDFQRIKQRKAKKVANVALNQHGLLRKGVPDSDELSGKRVDPANLTINLKKKLSKEEKLVLVRAGRVDRGKYEARAAIKQNKTGGLSNLQKEHNKRMPLPAKRAKLAQSQIRRNKQHKLFKKQFRGRKAWK